MRFGAYEQDGTDADGTEPITWLVLSRTDTELYVVSKYVLDNKYYQDHTESHVYGLREF
ncbi:MAG: hypothetical protein J6Y89_01310 [Lachnospiraceae bacterium]|nr:hypothetical protein [Lachnospiraceae bacterium]